MTHRGFADAELDGDLFVFQAFAYESDHLPFAAGQLSGYIRFGFGLLGLVGAPEIAYQACRAVPIEPELAGVYPMYRFHEKIGRRLLADHSVRPLSDGAVMSRLFLHRRENDDPGVIGDGLEFRYEVDAALGSQTEIEQNNLRLLTGGDRQSIGCVTRLPDYNHIGSFVNQHAQCRAYHCMIVNQENPDGILALFWLWHVPLTFYLIKGAFNRFIDS
jgi:hypothetical protein